MGRKVSPVCSMGWGTGGASIEKQEKMGIMWRTVNGLH